MTIKYTSSIFFLLFTIPILSAQKSNLTIIVTDQNSKEPIPYANVFISAPCNCGGTTDEKGALILSVDKGNYTLTTSYLGYETDSLQFSINQAKTLTILLEPTNYQLESVVIRGFNLRENIERTQMGVQQLSAKTIQKLPTAIGEIDVFRSLTMMSGVGNAGEASNGLSVRGGSLDQNLVLMDYAPIFNPTHLFGLFSVFTPDAMSEVDLYKANIPTKFGGRIASVMDLRVKSPSENQTLIKGGIGFVSTKLSVETPLIKDKLHILAAGRVAHNGFIFRLMDRLKNTKASFWDTTVKLNYRPNDRNQISATGFFSHDFNQLDIGSTINNVVATSNQNQYQMLNGTLNWLHTLGNQSVLRTTFVSSDYQPSLLFPQPDRTEKIVYQSRIQYQSWMQEWTSAQKEPLALTFGTQANRYQLSPGALLTNNIDGLSDFQLNEEISYELAGYAHANWEMSPKFSVSAGLRFTQYLLTGPFQQANYSDVNLSDVTSLINFEKGEKVIAYNGLEPRIGWRWQLSNNTAIKGNYDQTDQYFQNIYNSTTPLPTSRWKSADAYIKPQRGTTYSLGIYQNFKNDEFAVNVEGYYRTVKNVLDYQPGADFFLQAFIERAVQQGDGKAYGVELGINKPNGTINGWLNYTWSRSLRQFSAQSLKRRINNNRQFASDFDQPHVVNGVLNWEPNDFNTISFNFTYQTGRPYTIANGTFEVNDIKIPIFIERNNDRLPDYHRLDFSWRIHNFNMKTDKRWVGDWVFTVYNLYGRQNAYNWYYTQRDGGRLSEVFSDSPLGAFQLSIFSSPVFSLGYSFRFQ